ncbi:MAG: glycosyltransferase family 4 protein [Anaerolineales bacterium]|nr:glycosyltransferase family 4 protein [Anaerolineales bacterium]
MRLLMLNNEFPPLGGGTGTVNQAILHRLAQSPDLEIDLVTAAVGAEFSQERFAEKISIYRIPVRRWNIHHASNQELLLYAARAFRHGLHLHRSKPYDLCFAWSAVPAGGSALALRRLVGLHYLVRVCGPDIPGFEQRYGMLYPLLRPAIRAIWRGAEVVVAKCQGEADMIHAVDPGVKVTLVPNGVDLERFQPGELFPDEGPLRLLCVARLIERKGQSDLIRAVKMLVSQGVQVQLDIIGTGDAQEQYQRQAESLAVSGHVNFIGYVPRDEIPAWYASAHVFVLASYNEGMSVATLEAMASGLPVVVTRTGGTAELVDEGVNGLTFGWGDVAMLALHLRRLATDRNLARRMGDASRAKAAQFSWETAADAFVGLSRQIMNR